MEYSYEKYSDIIDFLKPEKKTNKPKLFSIPFSNQCKGLASHQGEVIFTSKCFQCNFCAFGELSEQYKNHINYPLNDSNFFKGDLIKLPTASKLQNPLHSLQTFTEREERKRIQKWEMGILKNILGDNFKTSEEIPAPSEKTDRPGRVDIGIYNKKNEVILVETKTTLDDTLNDERFVDQFSKYHTAIQKSKFQGNYLLCISIGGEEEDLLPPGLILENDIANKRNRLYNLLYNEGDRIPLISAAAIWCLSTLYFNKNIHDISAKLINVFSDQSNIALLSCGVIKRKGINSYEIIHLIDILN